MLTDVWNGYTVASQKPFGNISASSLAFFSELYDVLLKKHWRCDFIRTMQYTGPLGKFPETV